MTTEKKYNKLRSILKEMENVVVAFSGGVDSTFLLKVAYDVLKDRAFGVLAVSPSYPSREYSYAMKVAKQIGVRVEIINTKEIDDVRFVNNPVDRCYFCKSELFKKISEIAGSEAYKNMVDGSNFDDKLREKIIKKIKEIGYTYITLDLEGYHRGSMNELIK